MYKLYKAHRSLNTKFRPRTKLNQVIHDKIIKLILLTIYYNNLTVKLGYMETNAA